MADSPSFPQEDSQGNNDILWEFMVRLGPVPELITQPDVQEVGWGERLCRCSEAQLEAMKNGCYWKERAGAAAAGKTSREGMGLEAGEKPGPGPVQRQCRTYFFLSLSWM